MTDKFWDLNACKKVCASKVSFRSGRNHSFRNFNCNSKCLPINTFNNGTVKNILKKIRYRMFIDNCYDSNSNCIYFYWSQYLQCENKLWKYRIYYSDMIFNAFALILLIWFALDGWEQSNIWYIWGFLRYFFN